MDYPKVKVCLDTSEDNLIDELYTPCLKWAERFDRGVGYFTTGWLTYNVAGLSDFASRGGKMRLITSPILSTEDTDAIIGAENQDGSAFLRLEAALLENVEILKQEMEADIINAFSWMLYDGIIDMRFAIPCEKLEEGDFHDKFGIFYKGNDALSFSGSINDSKHGFQNYESIKVFKTWAGTQEYVDADTARFEKIWNRKDRNLKMFTIPQAVKNKIFELRTPDRPYSLPAGSNKWVHQDIAVKTFLEKEHGILAIATGTGKTITALKKAEYIGSLLQCLAMTCLISGPNKCERNIRISKSITIMNLTKKLVSLLCIRTTQSCSFPETRETYLSF